MSVHHCSFMSDNIVTFNEILTLLCHVPDSSASLQTMSKSFPEYYGATLKLPFQYSFLCLCHIGNVILLSLVTTLHCHQDSWDLRCWRHLTRLVTFLPHRLEMIYHISLACGEAVLCGCRVIHFRWSKRLLVSISSVHRQLHGHVLPIRRCTKCGRVLIASRQPSCSCSCYGTASAPVLTTGSTPAHGADVLCSCTSNKQTRGHRHARIQRGHDTLLPLLHSG